MRLLGDEDTLGGNNSKPRGAIEKAALALAKTGFPTQLVDGNELLTVVPLFSGPVGDMGGNCNVCHTTFDDGEIIGAAALRVPLQN